MHFTRHVSIASRDETSDRYSPSIGVGVKMSQECAERMACEHLAFDTAFASKVPGMRLPCDEVLYMYTNELEAHRHA